MPRLPPARISQFGKAAAEIKAPFFAETGKPTGPAAVERIYQEAVNIGGFLTYREIFRRDIKEFSAGKLLIVVTPTTATDYADIRVVGSTGKIEETILVGSTGLKTLAVLNAANDRPDELDLSMPPLHASWLGDDGFDEVAIYVRNMSNGIPASVGLAGTFVSIAGKLWR